MKGFLGVGFVALGLLPILLMPALLQAQQVSPSPGPVCMARPSNNAGSPVLVIMVPAAGQAAMETRGFAARACSGDKTAFTNYRTRICHLANDAPAVVQGQFGQTYNAAPRELCDFANAIAGS